MREVEFNGTVEDRIEECLRVLEQKKNYGSILDRLSNFKVAAKLQGITAIEALGGMMAKHVVSIYDLMNENNVPQEVWDEKITDNINYLLLLNALIRDKS